MASISRSALLRQQLRQLQAYGGTRALKVGALMLLVALLEGSGLMVLAPLLSVSGLSGSSPVDLPGPINAVLHELGMNLSIITVLLFYVGIGVLHAAASWWRDVSSIQLQQGFVDHLRLDLYRRIAAAEWSFLAGTDNAALGHTLSVDLSRISQGLQALIQLTTTCIIATVYLAIAFALSAPLTGMTLLLGSLLLLTLRRHHGGSHKAGFRLTGAGRRLYAEVGEFLAGLKLIKSGNLEAAAATRYEQRLAEARDESVAFIRRQALSRSLLRLGGVIVLGVLTYVALTVLRVPPASVLVLVFVFSRLLPFFSSAQQLYERLLYDLPAYASFMALRERCIAAAEAPDSGEALAFTREIRLEGLHYRPPGVDADVLRGVDIAIPWRSTVALIGPSGAGKSTVADIVGGLLEPTRGGVTVDGRPLADRRAWRRRVAYVSQDSFLLNASVRDNLLWANPDAGADAIAQALRQAAAEFVWQLPQGLDTVLGERGERLSGGERQRLAIARALLRNAQLLILDEATSALDRENERRIQESIAGLHGQITILIIAHRLSTVRHADCIVVLQDGRVREQGRYDELTQREAGYLMQIEAIG